MKEETWFKMLVISTTLHFVVICAFSIPIKKSSKRFDATSSYSVNLVGDIGGIGGPKPKPGGHSEYKPAPEKAPAKLSKPTPPQKTKPVLARKEKELVSLSNKKVPPKEPRAKETPTKEELSRLADRIREIKKRSEYLDVSRSKGPVAATGPSGAESAGYGLSSAGDGGSSTLDPAMQRYILGVWEKIKDSWGLPGMASFKKDLSTKVTIKIRKDGRIVDINMEERSGNKIYDESILRVLRSVDPLPPIPASLNMDTIEIGFRFMPGELS
jgi:colicin import membrane protein